MGQDGQGRVNGYNSNYLLSTYFEPRTILNALITFISLMLPVSLSHRNLF